MFIATLDCYIAWSQFFPTARALIGNFQVSWNQTMKLSALHLVKISGIFGSAVNGTRFVCSSHWKIPRKSGKSKKVDPFTRLEFPNGMSCSIYVSRRLYQFQVHGQAQRRPGVYDQMEQLFTNRKLNLGFHRNFRFFWLNGKRPLFPAKISDRATLQNLWPPLQRGLLSFQHQSFQGSTRETLTFLRNKINGFP